MPDLADEVEALEEEAEDKVEETAKPAATVVHNESSDLAQPVIDHAAKIAVIEERQAQHAVEMARAMSELENRLSESMNARLAAIEAAAARAAEAAAEPPEEVADLVEEEVEVPRVAAPERPRGVRGRRKARRNR